MSEFEYIEWLREQMRSAPNEPRGSQSRLILGPGDDTAELISGPSLLLTTDMLMDGVHFQLDSLAPELIGRKALAVNISDIAAMAGRPVAALISLALPRGAGRQLGEAVFRGVAGLAKEFDVVIAGGDTNSWNGPLVINIALVGDPPAAGAVRRSGAQAGDWLFVTGELGGSILHKHVFFTPRVQAARTLHQRYGIKAMLDLSDGLVADLSHLLKESRCGAVLDPKAIPISDSAATLSHDIPHASNQAPRTPLEHALYDGEDFELCFAVSAEAGTRLMRERPFGERLRITKIGECMPGDKLLWQDGQAVRPGGYVHTL